MRRLPAVLLSIPLAGFSAAAGFLAGEVVVLVLFHCDQTRSVCEGPTMIGFGTGVLGAALAGLLGGWRSYRGLRRIGRSTFAA